MDEQTHIKNRTQHEKYLEELKETDAYKLLKEVWKEVPLAKYPELYVKISIFLGTGILEGQYVPKL